MLHIEPVTLSTDRLLLRPMRPDDAAGFAAAATDGALWEKKTTVVPNPDGFPAYIAKALENQAAGTQVPFTTVVREGNRIVGSTRYMNIDAANDRLEIGTTWIAASWQRGFVNTHAKYLMLRHAFEDWNCIRVALKTDSINERSRRAILRIGAREEGTLRNHMITSTGRVRHTTYFSIIDSEWQSVKADLEAKLAREFRRADG